MGIRMKLFVFMLAATTLPVFTGCGVAYQPVTANPVLPSPGKAPNEWAWVSGSDIVNQQGSYGTLGMAASGNVPGARAGAVGWTDATGTLWLFGGAAPSVGGGCNLYDPLCWAGTNAWFNDLWKFSGGEWTWMGGSNTTDQPGTYGTLGVAAPGNAPGARYSAVSWSDASGNFWLFGGTGYDSKGNTGALNDLWKYSGGQWAWMGGSNAINQPGTYGTEGMAAPGNFPGARAGAVGFADASGNFLLFGGQGCDSTQDCGGALNDLWKYSGGQWTWMSGANISYPAQPGAYGIAGMAAPGNHPGGRYSASGWMDASGNLWIFGGIGYGAWNFNVGGLDDFWKFSGGQWAWMSGQNSPPDVLGTYGTEGMAAPGNVPGSRDSGMSWKDANGNLWFFGGEGFGSTYKGGGAPYFNDLWKYSGGQWTWMGGSGVSGQLGTYGTLGTAAPGNIAGGRISAVTWTDAHGNLWLFGGTGVDSKGGAGDLNDLWEYQP